MTDQELIDALRDANCAVVAKTELKNGSARWTIEITCGSRAEVAWSDTLREGLEKAAKRALEQATDAAERWTSDAARLRRIVKAATEVTQ